MIYRTVLAILMIACIFIAGMVVTGNPLVASLFMLTACGFGGALGEDLSK